MTHLKHIICSIIFALLPNLGLFSNIIFVHQNALPNCNDGSSWACAFTDLHLALAAADLQDTLWLAAGIYKTTETDDQYISFQLPSGVTLLGGFEGTEITSQQRNWENNPTILDGEIGWPIATGDNTFHLVVAKNLTATSTVDGLVFQNAFANTFVPQDGTELFGGGVFHFADSTDITSSLIIRNCQFTQNIGIKGACIATLGGENNLNTTIENCTFFDNDGGATAHYAESNFEGKEINVTISNCHIYDNNLNLSVAEGTTIFKNIAKKGRINFQLEQSLMENNKGAIGNEIDTAKVQVVLKNNQFLNDKGGIFRSENRFGELYLEVDSCEMAFGELLAFKFQNEENEAAEKDFIDFKNCSFQNNNNGFVEILGKSDATLFSITKCSFLENLLIEHELFDNYLSKISNGNFKIEDSDFINNSMKRIIGVSSLRSFFTLRNNVNSGEQKVRFNNCRFLDNIFYDCGPIIGITRFDSITISNCDFFRNEIKDSISLATPSLILLANTNDINNSSDKIIVENCKFLKNKHLDSFSHGMFSINFFNGSIPLVDSIFFFNCNFSNCDGWQGGAIYTNSINVHLENTLFAQNQAMDNNSGNGGALYLTNSPTTLTNCTFAYNEADDNGGAIYETNSTINVENCIFWGNQGNTSFNGMVFENGNNSNTPNTFINCLLQDPVCGEIPYAPNNICVNSLLNTDPIFTEPDSLDFSLLPCSPAINFGDNAFLDTLLQFDVLGNPRIHSEIVDAGAIESTDFEVEIDSLRHFFCADNLGGFVSFEVLGGCAPYQLAWATDNIAGLTATGLAAGFYEFTITDSRGSFTLQSVEIQSIPDFELNTQQVDYNCQTATGGSIFAAPSNPNLNYNYHWNTGDTSFIIGNLLPNIYSVTVSDEQGCSQEASVAIHTSELLPLGIEFSPISCHDSADGTAAVFPINGIAPFNFEWQTGETDSLLTNLAGGNYEVTVSDAIGCTDVLEFTTTPPDSLQIETNITNVQCADFENGSIEISVTGGTPDYFYLWNEGQILPDLENLPAGDYSLTVTDSKNCMDSILLIITEPQPINTDTSLIHPICFDTENGSIEINVTGGTLPFEFLWEDGSMDSIQNNLAVGNYEITIEDAQNCLEILNLTLNAPDSIALQSIIFPATTMTSANGAILIDEIIGGTPGYEFLWNTGDTSLILEGLLPAIYTLQITDSLGCQQIFEFEVSFNSNVFEEKESANFIIAPNPVSVNDFFQIETDKNFNQPLNISIYNAAGKLVRETTSIQFGEQIKPPGIAGTYFLKIEIGNELIDYVIFVVQ